MKFDKNTKILIDCGNTCKYICNKLESININPKDIDAILSDEYLLTELIILYENYIIN